MPDWTPELLDEEGKRAGRAMSWAKAAQDGEFQTEPFELLSIEGVIQFYSIVTTLFVAFAFVNSSSKLLKDILHYNDSSTLLEVLRAPVLAFV